jgi:phosphate/phosphite/phosphonate ABC transporter binding protein
MEDVPSDADFPRMHLGRFELIQRLEVGGMAEIFLALEQGLHDFERVVVVKRALPHLATKASFREMFLQEARWVARLNHPNIVQIYELGEAEGSAFIAMEHVPGVSFRELVSSAVERGASAPLGVVVGLVEQACAGAHAAHELTDPQGQSLGLVHRDISPHNLMVTAGGNVKLLDFGIAKATELGVDTTRPGSVKGKLHYMSPEQVLQGKLDRRSDVFSLGIVAWELLTLRRLFKRENDLATMQAITAGEPPRPDRTRNGIPPTLSATVMKALHSDPARRFATADDFRRALVTAAHEAKLRHGADDVAAWVRELVGDSLAESSAALKAAVERVKREGFSYDEPSLPRPITRSLPSASVSAPAAYAPLPSPTPPTQVARPVAQRDGKRAAVLRTVGLVAAFALSVGASLGYMLLRTPLSGATLVVGWAPTIDAAVLAEDVEPIRKHLERQTGHPVEFVYAESYHDLSERLLSGRIAYAAMPPALFVRTQTREPRIRSLVLKMVGGNSGSDGVLLAADSSGIEAVADLKGHTLCVPDKESTTGMLFPRVAAHKAGFDLLKDVTLVFSGNHLAVLRDLTTGKCQAGATYTAALLTAVTQGIDVTMLRQVAITGHSPQDSIVAGPNVAAADADALLQALLRYHPPSDRPAGSGAMERISGFTVARPEDYASVRELVRLEEGAR